VGKYSGATNFLYEYMCGADSIGRPVSVYNQTSDYTSNSRDKLKLAYIGDGIPLSCENIPVQRGKKERGRGEYKIGLCKLLACFWSKCKFVE